MYNVIASLLAVEISLHHVYRLMKLHYIASYFVWMKIISCMGSQLVD